MTVGEFIIELQKLDSKMVMMYADSVTGEYFEVVGAPYQLTIVKTTKGLLIPKDELPMWNLEDEIIEEEFEAISL